MRCQLALFSAYRIDQYGDPEGFKTSLGAVLEQYPDDVIMFVCDPRTGVQRRCKFPPTISEIVQALDDRVADLARRDRFEHWGDDRERAKDNGLLPPPREARSTYSELKAKYGDNWGIADVDPVRDIAPHPKSSRAMTSDEILAHYRTHGLGFRPKDDGRKMQTEGAS